MKVTKLEIQTKVPTITDQFALWFIGTSMNCTLHPTYGFHMLTKEQFKYSSADYKDTLYDNIICAIVAETSISGKENIFTKKLNIIL
jgi:hypothetical protein